MPARIVEVTKVRKIGRKSGRFVVMLSMTLAFILAGTVSFGMLVGPERGIAPSAETSAVDTSTDDTGEWTAVPEDDYDAVNAMPVMFNKPSEMRAVYLVPGSDFMKSAQDSEAALKQQIDTAIANAKSYSMNTIIVDTLYGDHVIYKTDNLPTVTETFDPMQYIVDQSRAANLYVYAIFNSMLSYQDGKLETVPYVDGSVIDFATQNAVDFAERYQPDGMLLDAYYFTERPTTYATYMSAGGNMGYDNYMGQASQSVVSAISAALRKQYGGVQIGLLADPVWENKSANDLGSDTKTEFTALSGGHADTRAFVLNHLVDFVAVKNFHSLADQNVPFLSVLKWWGEVATQAEMPLYVVHAADKVGTNAAGWSGSDELARQVIESRNIEGYHGSMFNSLQRLVENPGDARTLLVKYFNNEAKPEHILTELTISKPAQTKMSTFEPNVVFAGASDPNEEVLMNDKAINTDQNGYFNETIELTPGENVFTFTHKGKTIIYTIVRQVQVLKEITPVGNVSLDGNMVVSITAVAYEGATVTASVNGATVKLSPRASEEDETYKESAYQIFAGEYTCPPATTAVQSLGNIVVTASWSGVNESKSGAAIKVNKKAVIGSGKPVQVIADEAETFSTSKLDDLSEPNYFPLPKGAIDETVGDEIIYRDGNNTYSYYTLASDLRVYSKDISSISNGVSNNKIVGMTVNADSQFTKVILATEQKVSYTLRYSQNEISITFHNTTAVPGNLDTLTKNPLFASAKWSGTTLKLALRSSGGFVGYYAYYDASGLCFRFNNPPPGLSGARIVIDPGHGYGDPGALGFNAYIPESVINRQVAAKVKSLLAAKGANVLLIETSSYRVSLDERVSQAKNFNAQVFVSVHANAAASSSAAGSEAYYFTGFSAPLANYLASNLASAVETNNRGGLFGYYRVTRTARFAASLSEAGFVTNRVEYNKLIDDGYQDDIAAGIVSAISSYLNRVGAGNNGRTGTESVGKSSVVTVPVTSVALNKTTLSLAVGASEQLVATVKPDEATDKTVTWTTSDPLVATVDAQGNVKAVKEGSATITVTTVDGAKKAECKLTVQGVGVTGVAITPKPDGGITLEKDATIQLTATVTPANAANKAVVWSSSNTTVATVDTTGKVTAKGIGSANITVTTVDGGKTDSVGVTVNAASVAVTGVTLDITSLTMTVGDTNVLVATVKPDNATNKAVTWQSSNSSIVTVDAAGNIKAMAVGTVTITVKTADSNKTATCQITVKAAPASSSQPDSSSSGSSSGETSDPSSSDPPVSP